MSWETRRIGDVAKVEHGFAFKSQFFSDSPTKYHLVTPGNFILGGGFNTTKCKYYEGPFVDGHVLQAGDLIVTMTDLSRNTDALGGPALVPQSKCGEVFLHNQRIGKLLINKEEINPRFLYYSMCLESTRSQVVATATGTTVKHTSPKRIEAVEIECPRLDTQGRIAEVLGAFDDKIAANQRVLQISNELLRVNYLDLMEGPLTNFSDIAVEIREKAEPQQVDEQTVQVSLEHFESKSIWLERWGTARDVESTKSQFQKGDLLFGKLRPYFHKVSVAVTDGICSTDVLVIRAKDPSNQMLVSLAGNSDSVVDRAVMNSNGTRMPRAKWTDIADCVVPDPSAPKVQIFCEGSLTVFHRAQAAIAENQTLARTRDELLPLLMNGKITVAEAKDEVEALGVDKHAEGAGDV
ncbi:restriction endonuclease subunit S [Corynebacterium sp. H130]|uniref:restriction endonuclease subunit S n=1 Tax=Corynebacterium sp. H130 TaxID=3133444 RepID=UPI00309DEBA4